MLGGQRHNHSNSKGLCTAIGRGRGGGGRSPCRPSTVSDSPPGLHSKTKRGSHKTLATAVLGMPENWVLGGVETVRNSRSCRSQEECVEWAMSLCGDTCGIVWRQL